MKAINRLREELREIHTDSVTETKQLTLSAEQINLFVDSIVIPTFEQIEKELRNLPLRIFIRRFPTIAQIIVNDASSSFNFRLVIDNKISRLFISFHYRSKATVNEADNLFLGDLNHGVKYTCKTMDLVDYKKITEECLIEMFTKYYLKREEIAAEIIAQLKVKEAETFTLVFNESQRVRRKSLKKGK